MSWRPPDEEKKELTLLSAVGAIIVSAIVGAAFPYIVLKLGMGPNVSILSAFMGAAFLKVFGRATRGNNTLTNNIIQTAGTSASSTAFMCVVLAGFDYLGMMGGETMKIGSWQVFIWLSVSGAIGVLMSALFRSLFIEDKDMIFADGIASAETIRVLDGAAAGNRLPVMAGGTVVGALLAFVRDGLGWFPMSFIAKTFSVGTEWSLLSFGTGLLVGPNVGLSMLLGTLVVWVFGPSVVDMAHNAIITNSIAPEHLAACQAVWDITSPTKEQVGFITANCGQLGNYQAGKFFPIAMLWLMWPATTFMIASALTAVLLQWRSLVAMVKAFGSGRAIAGDVSSRIIIVGVVCLTAVLAVVQYVNFGIPPVQTVVSVAFGIPLVLAGLRVLGETNQGPVSLMSNGLQAVFRLFSAHVPHNLAAAGMAGNINAQAEGTMQDYKTGQLLGSTPSVLTWVQLCAVPIGAAAVAIMYPLLVSKYGLGDGLSAPTGLKLANMAVLMGKGLSAFPPGALQWALIATVAGVVVELLRSKAGWKWIPSPSGFGFALILPGILNIPIAAGAFAGWAWSKIAPDHHREYHITVASGFIAGEALIAGLLLPVLFTLGVL
jgi:uncharacterized oligopeptide transporter (OPT) family protein